MKECTKCHGSFPLDGFYGRNSWCKKCFNALTARHYRSPKGRYVMLKKDAKARGIPFSLEFAEYEQLYGTRCSYCGAEVTNATGLDRLDNSKGYEKSNVIPCCKWCNYAKGKWSSRAFYEKCLRVVDNFPERLKTRGQQYSDKLQR